MKAVVKIKFPGDTYVTTIELSPDRIVHVHNQKPDGKEFNWVGEINEIPIKISNGSRYASELDIDPKLNTYRNEFATAISVALKEWD